MKKWIFISAILISGYSKISAQTSTSASTIAVAKPYVNNLASNAESVAKMMRLELIKLNLYKVYDEFDMNEIIKSNEVFQKDCFGQGCLTKMGEELKTDYILFGSFDQLSNRIVASVKMIDVKNKTLFASKVREFDDQEFELQRMVEIVLKELNSQDVEKEVVARLAYKNEPITSTNVGRINNSGPRIGVAYLLGSVNEFAIRNETQGGLGITPVVSMIGYQFEKQYVGTDNFSALVECITNVSGIEQGQFIPTITVMNGFRFGKAGWEFAFGPGIGLKKTSTGFFDTENKFRPEGGYFSESDWNFYADRTYMDDPAYQVNGSYSRPNPSEFVSSYSFAKHGDTRGDFRLNTSFVFALGRTFHAGALNIPVNAFYSSQKGGGMVGLNIGFNVQKSKLPIHH
jgi:hypothetical protein